ncbi:MarR family transcriptional regulator [Mesosutterella sp. AGMB02718]|uniref:MarR family transcriptional regulator n=1 Tax=Mesosutterella faecium TaxID=2925194 RepID=A0ABT7INF4_9BURK|nr:MarR family transcriptional regulator [Mesosutterella sp. AGMB02718]MDL2059909.1 MarR family transcriptional regulator [Mesosutterella sp. AGMB02718]
MELDSTLGYILGRVSRKVHYRLDGIFKSRDITIEQWVGLRIIHEDGPLCQKKLSDLMEKNQNTVKALVDRLEGKGLIRRSVDPGDKRNLILELTGQGLALLRSLSPLEAEVNALIEGSLTPRQTDTLKNLLLKLEKKL